MLERARLDALLRLGAVVVLYVVSDPGEDLRRHADAVHRVAAVEPAPGLLRAHGDLEGQAAVLIHAPEDEHARRGSRYVEVIALGFVAMKLQREPGMQPLREARLVAKLPRLTALVAREHARWLPHAIDPAVLHRSALHDDSHLEIGLAHRPANVSHPAGAARALHSLHAIQIKERTVCVRRSSYWSPRLRWPPGAARVPSKQSILPVRIKHLRSRRSIRRRRPRAQARAPRRKKRRKAPIPSRGRSTPRPRSSSATSSKRAMARDRRGRIPSRSRESNRKLSRDPSSAAV